MKWQKWLEKYYRNCALVGGILISNVLVRIQMMNTLVVHKSSEAMTQGNIKHVLKIVMEHRKVKVREMLISQRYQLVVLSLFCIKI